MVFKKQKDKYRNHSVLLNYVDFYLWPLHSCTYTETHTSRLASKFTHTHRKGGSEGGKMRGKETLKRKKPLNI